LASVLNNSCNQESERKKRKEKKRRLKVERKVKKSTILVERAMGTSLLNYSYNKKNKGNLHLVKKGKNERSEK
jgi:hypothetical protein